jgi:hypothetical protein
VGRSEERQKLSINPALNNRARLKLLSLLREERAIALTGAGLSVWAGYPSWPALLERLVIYITEHGDGTVAEKERAEEIKNSHVNPVVAAGKLGGMLSHYDFANFINEELGPKSTRSHEMVSAVAGLPFRHFLTLNLDPTLHDALLLRNDQPFGTFTWYQTASVVKFLKSLTAATKQYERQLVHVHGRYSDPLDCIALTGEGYEAVYGKTLFESFLLTLAITQRIVFLGFGFKDKTFMEPFRKVAQQIESHDLCHFAIVAQEEGADDSRTRNQYRDDWCVEPVADKPADWHRLLLSA